MDLLLAAIREEQVGATHGAQGRGKDLVSLDTGAGQLVAIRTEKVNTCVSAACRSEQGLLIRELHIESINHVSTHLITTTARCWSNRCDHVFRFSAVPATHLSETFQGDTSQRSTPGYVNGRISSGNRIGQQKRNTICSLYACQHPSCIADDRIAVNRFTSCVLRRFRIRGCMDQAHVRSVDLPAAGQGPLARKELEKPATILQNVFRSVFIKAGEVERLFRHRACAAAAG